MTGDASRLFSLLVSLNWRWADTDSRQTLVFVSAWRMMRSEPLTHLTVMSWHTVVAAQLWTISRARSPHLLWIMNQPESSVWHRTKNDIIPDFSSRPFHQALAGPDLRGRLATGGIAPNQQIISEALWSILFESETDCTHETQTRSRKLRRIVPACLSVLNFEGL